MTGRGLTLSWSEGDWLTLVKWMKLRREAGRDGGMQMMKLDSSGSRKRRSILAESIGTSTCLPMSLPNLST